MQSTLPYKLGIEKMQMLFLVQPIFSLARNDNNGSGIRDHILTEIQNKQ